MDGYAARGPENYSARPTEGYVPRQEARPADAYAAHPSARQQDAAPYGYDAPYGQGSPGNVSSGRPPIAPAARSAKEEYAAALRAQMAEKEARQPRGRSRVRTPESSAPPYSVGMPASRDPSQDRRTAQLEYAAA